MKKIFLIMISLLTTISSFANSEDKDNILLKDIKEKYLSLDDKDKKLIKDYLNKSYSYESLPEKAIFASPEFNAKLKLGNEIASLLIKGMPKNVGALSNKINLIVIKSSLSSPKAYEKVHEELGIEIS